MGGFDSLISLIAPIFKEGSKVIETIGAVGEVISDSRAVMSKITSTLGVAAPILSGSVPLAISSAAEAPQYSNDFVGITKELVGDMKTKKLVNATNVMLMADQADDLDAAFAQVRKDAANVSTLEQVTKAEGEMTYLESFVTDDEAKVADSMMEMSLDRYTGKQIVSEANAEGLKGKIESALKFVRSLTIKSRIAPAGVYVPLDPKKWEYVRYGVGAEKFSPFVHWNSAGATNGFGVAGGFALPYGFAYPAITQVEYETFVPGGIGQNIAGVESNDANSIIPKKDCYDWELKFSISAYLNSATDAFNSYGKMNLVVVRNDVIVARIAIPQTGVGSLHIKGTFKIPVTEDAVPSYIDVAWERQIEPAASVVNINVAIELESIIGTLSTAECPMTAITYTNDAGEMVPIADGSSWIDYLGTEVLENGDRDPNLSISAVWEKRVEENGAAVSLFEIVSAVKLYSDGVFTAGDGVNNKYAALGTSFLAMCAVSGWCLKSGPFGGLTPDNKQKLFTIFLKDIEKVSHLINLNCSAHESILKSNLSEPAL